MSFQRKKDFSKFTQEEIDKSAFERVARAVCVSEQSSIKMRKKLEAAGYPQSSIDKAIEKAIRIGAIDDRRYSECLIRSTIAMGKGLKFVEKEIEELGIDINTLDSYNDYLEDGEEAQIESAFSFLERHPSRAKNLRDSSYRKLINKGFSSYVAATASRKYVEYAQSNEDTDF